MAIMVMGDQAFLPPVDHSQENAVNPTVQEKQRTRTLHNSQQVLLWTSRILFPDRPVPENPLKPNQPKEQSWRLGRV